jgi:serine/threonine-protein kinase
MLTGRRAFPGETRAAVVTRVLTASPPPVTAVRPDLPDALDGIVANCLAKEPEERWQNAGDVGRQLRALAGGTTEGKALPAKRGLVPPRWPPWGTAAAGLSLATLAVLAAVALVRTRGQDRTPGPTVRFSIPPPPGGEFEFSVEQTFLAVSPDGSQLVYAATDSDGVERLWIRPLASLEARPIPGTEGAESVFWSPDGRSIGFFSGSKLKRLDLPAGAPVAIREVLAGGGKSGTWGKDGKILFAPVQGEALYRVPAAGGSPEPLIRPDRAKGEIRVCWPWFLPDGVRYLYVVRIRDGEGSLMLSEPGALPRAVMPVDSAV